MWSRRPPKSGPNLAQLLREKVAKRVQLRLSSGLPPSDPLFLRQGTNKLFGTGFDS